MKNKLKEFNELMEMMNHYAFLWEEERPIRYVTDLLPIVMALLHLWFRQPGTLIIGIVVNASIMTYIGCIITRYYVIKANILTIDQVFVCFAVELGAMTVTYLVYSIPWVVIRLLLGAWEVYKLVNVLIVMFY